MQNVDQPEFIPPKREQPLRYKLLHQRLCLDINVEQQCVTGYTDLVVLPTTHKLKFVYLDFVQSKGVRIDKILVDGHESSYTFLSTVPTAATKVNAATGSTDSVQLPALSQVRDYRVYDMHRNINSDHHQLLGGNLQIRIEKSIKDQLKAQYQRLKREEAEALVDIVTVNTTDKMLDPLIVRVYYTIHRPTVGLLFSHTASMDADNSHLHASHGKQQHKPNQLHTTSHIMGESTSTWLPTIDRLSERFTVEMELYVDSRYVIVAAGNLTSRQYTDGSDQRVCYKFSTGKQLVAASTLAIAVAPFTVVPILRAESAVQPTGGVVAGNTYDDDDNQINRTSSADIDDGSDIEDGNEPASELEGVEVLCFVASQASEKAAATAQTTNQRLQLARQLLHNQIHAMLQHIQIYLSTPYTYHTLQIIFVDHLYGDAAYQCNGNIIFLHTRYLHTFTEIESAYDTISTLCSSIIMSWLSSCITLEHSTDLWLLYGLSYMITYNYCEEIFGKNEMDYQHYLLRQKLANYESPMLQRDQDSNSKDKFQVEDSDVIEFETLNSSAASSSNANAVGIYSPTHHAYLDQLRLPLYYLGYIHRSDFGLHQKMYAIKAGIVMQLFENKLNVAGYRQIWTQVLNSCCVPRSSSDSALLNGYDDDQLDASLSNTTDSSQLQPLSTRSWLNEIRQSAADQIPAIQYIAEQYIYCDGIPSLHASAYFNSKTNAVTVTIKQQTNVFPSALKSSSNFRTRVYEQDRTSTHDNLVENELHEFLYETTGKSTRKRVVRKIDESVSAEEKAQLTKTMWKEAQPVLYCHLDIDAAWIRSVTVEQEELMLINQLTQDRTVDGQLAAIRGITELQRTNKLGRNVLGDATVTQAMLPINTLKAAYNNSKLFYAVRLAAAETLVHTTYTTGDGKAHAGWRVVFDSLRAHMLDSTTDMIKPNDFTHIDQYLIRRQCITLLSGVRLSTQDTPTEIVDFLIQLIQQNNNQLNPYTDHTYKHTLALALGQCRSMTIETKSVLSNTLIKMLQTDSILPSRFSFVTEGVLHSIGELIYYKQWLPTIGEGYYYTSSHPLKFDFIGYTASSYPLGVQLSAVRALTLLVPRYPQALDELISVLRQLTRRPDQSRGTTARYILAIAECVEAITYSTSVAQASSIKNVQILQLDAFTQSAALMNTLWQLLLTVQHDTIATSAVGRLYQSLYGRLTPAAGTTEQKQAGLDLWHSLQALEQQHELEDELSTYRLRRDAATELKRLRGKRTFGSRLKLSMHIKRSATQQNIDDGE